MRTLDPLIYELNTTVMRLPTNRRIRRAVIEPTLNLPTTDEAWTAIQTREKDLHDLVPRAAQVLGGT